MRSVRARAERVKHLRDTDSVCAVNVGVSALAMRIGFEDSILISRALNCLLTAQKDAAEADAVKAAMARGAGLVEVVRAIEEATKSK